MSLDEIVMELEEFEVDTVNLDEPVGVMSHAFPACTCDISETIDGC